MMRKRFGLVPGAFPSHLSADRKRQGGAAPVTRPEALPKWAAADPSATIVCEDAGGDEALRRLEPILGYKVLGGPALKVQFTHRGAGPCRPT